MIIVLMTVICSLIGYILAVAIGPLTSPAAPALFAGLGAIVGFVMSRRTRTAPLSATPSQYPAPDATHGQPGADPFTEYTGDDPESGQPGLGGGDMTRPRSTLGTEMAGGQRPHGAQSPWADQ
jgi:hypothetical protein